MTVVEFNRRAPTWVSEEIPCSTVVASDECGPDFVCLHVTRGLFSVPRWTMVLETTSLSREDIEEQVRESARRLAAKLAA